MSIAHALHEALVAVCPIDGVSIGRWEDRDTWRIDFKAEATEEQKAAAVNILNSFNPVEAAKAGYANRIDEAAEQLRLKYLSPGAGMTMTYQEKLVQARAVQELGEAAANALTLQQYQEQYPTLAASVGVEAASLFDCANLVVQKYKQFAQLSYVIEKKRLQAKKAIRLAQTEEELKAIVEEVQWKV